jgi:hypothetical protein
MKPSPTAALLLISLVCSGPAIAGQPEELAFEVIFDDVNPCTGLVHTVTISGTTFEHRRDGQVTGHSNRLITTSPTGFVGHGTDSFVRNGQIVQFRLTDILANESGERIKAQIIVVMDVSTGRVAVEHGQVTCLGN